MAASFPTLRRALAGSLDDIGIYGVTSGTGNTVTITAIGDATTNASANRYDGRWIYYATGAAIGQQRRVIAGGFSPGAASLTLELTGVAPGAGDVAELTALFPAIEAIPGEDTSYRTILNRAAGMLARAAEITLPITTGYSYDLGNYGYLDRPGRLLRVLEPGPTGRRPIDAAWRGWRWRPDTAGSFLELATPFETAAGVLTLEVIRPVRNWVFTTAGGWAASGTGLTAETDFLDVDVEDILDTARMVAYEVLLARSPGRPLPGAAAQAELWRERAMQSRLWDRTQMAPQAPTPSQSEAVAR